MYPFPTLDHAQLLRLAQSTLDAAYDHDPRRVGANTLELFLTLTDHALEERSAFLWLTPGDARLLERGQQRLVHLLQLLADSAAGNTCTCSCSRIADHLVAEIQLQAADEHRYLLHPRPAQELTRYCRDRAS